MKVLVFFCCAFLSFLLAFFICIYIFFPLIFIAVLVLVILLHQVKQKKREMLPPQLVDYNNPDLHYIYPFKMQMHIT